MKSALAAGLLALAAYLSTLAPGLTEIDSGELAAVAGTLGVAHPSGYPLFSFVGRAWTVFSPIRVITWMNVLSALFAAGAVVLLFRTIRDLLPEGARGRQVAAWTGALGFAFHGTFWSVANVTEVHALQMFLDAAVLHALVKSGLWGGHRFRERAFLGLAYFMGLALANHLTAVWILPAIAVGMWRFRAVLRAPVLGGAVLCGLLGLSVYAFLPVRSALEPYLDWGSPDSVETFVRHVSGQQYRVWIFASGAVQENLPRLGEGLLRFGAPLLALAAWGLFRSRRLPGVLAGTVVMATFTAGYPLGYSIHDIDTYFLPPFLVVAVWSALGVAAAAQWAHARSSSPPWSRAVRALPALALLPAVPMVLALPEANRRDDRYVEAMARSLLETPPPDAVVLDANWDVLMSPVLYLQSVEGVRPDLVVLDQEHFRRGWMIPWMRVHHPELLAGLEEEAEALHAWVLRFERNEPYDAARIQAAFEALLSGILEKGMKAGGAYVTQEIENGIARNRIRVPDGLLLRLVPGDEVATRLPEPPWPDLPPAGEGGVWAERCRQYAGRMAGMAGIAAMRIGDPERAEEDLRRALSWNPEDRVARSTLEALRSGTP